MSGDGHMQLDAYADSIWIGVKTDPRLRLPGSTSVGAIRKNNL